MLTKSLMESTKFKMELVSKSESPSAPRNCFQGHDRQQGLVHRGHKGQRSKYTPPCGFCEGGPCNSGGVW